MTSELKPIGFTLSEDLLNKTNEYCNKYHLTRARLVRFLLIDCIDNDRLKNYPETWKL